MICPGSVIVSQLHAIGPVLGGPLRATRVVSGHSIHLGESHVKNRCMKVANGYKWLQSTNILRLALPAGLCAKTLLRQGLVPPDGVYSQSANLSHGPGSKPNQW